MKKYLIFLVLILSHFSIYAEGIKLSCSPISPSCDDCPDYQTLFPVKNLLTDVDNLNIEADESEIINDKYKLSGNVEINSENLYISADKIEVSPESDAILAAGNVNFQDQAFIISSDLLSATKDENDNLIATATNAYFQDFASGPGGANGFSEIISRTPSSVLLTNSTYTLCPINKGDWYLDADKIELNLLENRGVADNVIIKFYGQPIFYLPKYSWVLSGRGSGFLAPNYSTYREAGLTEDSYRLRVPYYLNIAPDRDLTVALNFISSRGLITEGKYRQLIAPKTKEDGKDSIMELEVQYLNADKITKLKRWLVDFSQEVDLTPKINLKAKYNRVSDEEYFQEILFTNTDSLTLKSYLELNYVDEKNNLSASILSEDEQVVNAGTPLYTRALEGSIYKTYNANKNLPIKLGIVSTKFDHNLATKETGVRTHGDIGISRRINLSYPSITPRASLALTNYSLKSNPNINRAVFGSGLDIDFTVKNQTNLFGFEAIHSISPKITYNYKAKKAQGNIPIFDSTDKYDEIISVDDLISGERYTGLDRITNANDITLSFESSYKDINALDTNKDLLSMKIAQSFFADNDVVSDSDNNNYETRGSYSDIVASVDLAINKFSLSSASQFDPDKSKLVRKENTVSYTSSSRQFLSLSFIDEGTKKTNKFYGAYPITDSMHVFGGIDKTTSTSITNTETKGIAYESCCWAFRLAHFKENTSKGYNYSTGIELVFTGLGSTSSKLNEQIETNIPGYRAKFR